MMFGGMKDFLGQLSLWVGGARLRTLPAAIVPVAAGTGIASQNLIWGRFVLALAVSLCLQVGVNFANDYSDGKRGVDNPEIRRGPVRLTGSGIKKPGAVLAAALVFFLAAGVCGLILAAWTSWWLLAFGAAALLAAWGYTGRPFPYGYRAMGEAAVFIFFGLFAVAGSAYVQFQKLVWEVWMCGAGIGLMSVGVLIANNYRDIENDKQAGKKTLAVLLGEKVTLKIYPAVVLGAALLAVGQVRSTLLVLLATAGSALSLILLEFSRSGTRSEMSPVIKLGHAVLGLTVYGAGLSVAYWINPAV